MRIAHIIGLYAVLAGCSAPSLSGTNFACASDADCSDGKICGQIAGKAACVSPDLTPIKIGMSGPLQGPSQGLGIEMRRGISALFQRVNDTEGGVFGRQLELSCMNDNYDPATALANAKQLLDVQQESASADVPDVRGAGSVLALLGNIGTPPMLQTAPLATKDHVVFFAPFTGAQKYLRDGTDSPYVYNYRAGYYEETAAMVDYMQSYRAPRIITSADSYRRILAFTQHDSYGDAGYAGLVTAYNTRVAPVPQPDSTLPEPSIARVMYEREDVSSVDPAIQQAETFLSGILAQGTSRQSVAVVMIDTYQPGNKFIRAVKDWLNADATRASLLDVLFIHVSFVGSDSLALALTSPPETYPDVTDATGQTKTAYAAGVMVTQVVPYYQSQAPAVAAYRTDLANFDAGTPSFTSLEGYIAAQLFVAGLKLNGPILSDDNLVKTFDSNVSDLDIGIGTRLSFSSTNHQASHTVWGTTITADGKFDVPFIWNPEDKIIPGSN
jgi:branched-chain amino acid transport system substrate-binding protein